MNNSRYIIAGKFINGTGADIRKNVFVEITDTMITDIGQAADLTPDTPVTIDDLSHCIILPALIDCSVQLSRSPSIDNISQNFYRDSGSEVAEATVNRHIKYCHTHGVLGVAINDDVNTSLPINTPTGLPDIQGGLITIKSSSQRHASEAGLPLKNSREDDFLWIDYSGSIDNDNSPRHPLTKDLLSAALKNRGRKKTVVRANGQEQVKDAIDAGCDAIEQGYGMGAENLQEMAHKGMLWIPSILRAKNGLDGAATGGDVCCRFSQRYVAPGKPVPGAEQFWKNTLANQLRQLQSARDIGLTTAVGTGAGNTGILHGESVVEEMKLFMKAGYSLVETIRCATENGAHFFEMKELGALAVGRKATFLVARGAVQQMPRKLAYLEEIYINGKPSPAYNKNPTTA